VRAQASTSHPSIKASSSFLLFSQANQRALCRSALPSVELEPEPSPPLSPLRASFQPSAQSTASHLPMLEPLSSKPECRHQSHPRRHAVNLFSNRNHRYHHRVTSLPCGTTRQRGFPWCSCPHRRASWLRQPVGLSPAWWPGRQLWDALSFRPS
jgi:hypothetical protein